MYILLILGIIISCIWTYYKLIKPVKYWQERDVPHARAWPVVGTLKDVSMKKKHIADVMTEIYQEFSNER